MSINMIPEIIFIGDTHGFVDDFNKQKELILKFKPAYVLAESMKNNSLPSEKKYKKLLEKKYVSDITSFSEVKRLVELCYEKNIKLIGIDFKNFGMSKSVREKIKNNKKITKSEEINLDKIVKKRERKQNKMVLKYSKKTEKPLLIITGSWHLRKNSPLFSNIKKYKLIMPCDEEGNVLYGPKKVKETKYCEITYGKKKN